MKPVTFDRVCRTIVISVALGLFSQVSRPAEFPSVGALERDFAMSNDLSLLHSLGELPPDERDLFLTSGVLSTGIAEFGEVWNTTDAGRHGVPRRQFLFAGVSNRLLAVAYLEGSFGGPVLRLYLKYRGSHAACLYYLGKPPEIFAMKLIRAYFADAPLKRPSCSQHSLTGDR